MIEPCIAVVLLWVGLESLGVFRCSSDPTKINEARSSARACNALLYEYGTAFQAKRAHSPESKLIAHARDLDVYLEQHMTTIGREFTCADAKAVLFHSNAKSFLEELTDYVVGKNNEASLHDTIEHLEGLEKELKQFRKQDHINEVAEAANAVRLIGRQNTKVHAAYRAVLNAPHGYDCAPDFKHLISELKTLIATADPNWLGVVEIIEQQVEECHGNPALKEYLIF